MPSSSFLRTKFVDITLKAATAYTVAATWVGLHTADPGVTGLNEQIAAGWYARQPVTWGTNVAGSDANTGTITFAAVVGATCIITSFGVWDAVSGGNMLYYGTLSVTKTFNAGDVPSWLTGTLAVVIV